MIPLTFPCNSLEKFYFQSQDSKDLFEIADGKIRIRRTKVGFSNALVSSTVSGEGGTTINGSSEAVDFDKATMAVILNDTEQIVKFELPTEEIVNAISARFLLEEGESLQNVTIEISPDGTSYKEIYSDVPDSESLYFSIDSGNGAKIKSLRLITHGTSLDTNKVFLKEIQAYPAICYDFYEFKETPTVLAIQSVAKAKLLTLTTFDVTFTKSGVADLRFQVEKSGTRYYWDGSAWTKCSSSTLINSDRLTWLVESNTLTEVQAQMASFLSGSQNYEVGITILFVTDEEITPVLESIDIQGT